MGLHPICTEFSAKNSLISKNKHHSCCFVSFSDSPNTVKHRGKADAVCQTISSWDSIPSRLSCIFLPWLVAWEWTSEPMTAKFIHSVTILDEIVFGPSGW